MVDAIWSHRWYCSFLLKVKIVFSYYILKYLYHGIKMYSNIFSTWQSSAWVVKLFRSVHLLTCKCVYIVLESSARDVQLFLILHIHQCLFMGLYFICLSCQNILLMGVLSFTFLSILLIWQYPFAEACTLLHGLLNHLLLCHHQILRTFSLCQIHVN